jgi:hypothetical protein
MRYKMLARMCALLVLAGGLMAPADGMAKKGKSPRNETVRLFYIPLNVSTFKAVSQRGVESDGDSCVIAKQAVVACIRELLASAHPARTEKERFSNQYVRVKMWLREGRSERLLAVVEQDGRMLRDGDSFVLSKKELSELERVIVGECFGGVKFPSNREELKKQIEQRR